MASARDPAARLRQGLNPLTTSMTGFNNQFNTPISAISMASSHMTAQTPASTILPYNPQNWGPTPGVVAERAVQYADPQASPPPPPYSPPRSTPGHPIASVFDQVPAPSPTPPRLNPAVVHRPSPEPQASFPPPPGTAPRGQSRERRFLPSLRNRRGDVDRNTNSPDPHPPVPRARQSMIVPASYQVSTPDRAEAVPAHPYIGPPHAAPAARRAVSADPVGTPISARSRSSSQTRWEPGMPLPPPPPGPPPPGSRSQSVQAVDRTPAPIISPPTRRPPPSTGASALGPVPPTPADWIDSDHPPPQAEPARRSPGLVIDTDQANSGQAGEPLGSSQSSAGLSRAGAVRHDKTIIQRRNESRTRQSVRGSIDERTQPSLISDIVIPSQSTVLARRMNANKSTPQSGQTIETPGTGDSVNLDSRNSTPRATPSATLPKLETGTPPFSPLGKQPAVHTPAIPIAPKALPTPPPNTNSAASSVPRDSSRPPSAVMNVSRMQMINQTGDQFARGTIERFQEFAAKESSADNDADRVRLFADFIVNESRIRRERYSSAIGAMGSEIFDLTRDLFRPMGSHTRRASNTSNDVATPASSNPVRTRQGSFNSSFQGEDSTQSAPNSAGVPDSPSNGRDANWSQNYRPSLSPILSMSVSDNHDEEDSRGRAPSRWWEVDSSGEPSRMERVSKRESKYMGVSKSQWYEDDQSTPNAGPSDQSFPSSEYPPEKVGWHEEAALTPQQFNVSTNSISSTISSTPTSLAHREYLDVSRLVTMPPPYPRHHPAVNNNHPELTDIRSSVRSLSEISEVKETKEKFEAASKKRRDDFAKGAAERKQALRANLQSEINSGNLSYADAGVIEQDAKKSEIDRTKELEKTEYALFQNEVVMPLNELVTERISRATDLFDDLARKLFDDGRIDADIPQEEGDDRPELLEKLTLLKWIFEARETLHKAIFDLLSDRNGRYCEVILTPYRLSGNNEKLKQAQDFFADDSAKRDYAYANEVLNRLRDFRGVIEEAVTHGVTLQVSAFWDIAPPLSGLLEQIPQNLEDFNIQIPPAEYDENPAYHEHPMQYLFSLLLHAEKSTYQFIEAHTNLLCLLHEVKESVVNAKGKVLETQVEDANGKPIPEAERQENSSHMRRVEAERLTEDLKEKVRVVQDQWNNALGENIKQVKERLGEWLLQTGGWDESLEDGGVGGV